MITLAADCLVFRLANGESVPYSAEMLPEDLMSTGVAGFADDFLQQAAHAVFHYFKEEAGRQTVSVGEFTEALEKVLRSFRRGRESANPVLPAGESDLWQLARESEEGELFFLPRLREELLRQLRGGHQVLRFRGLRACVKQLTGARRWSFRCRQLESQILDYLSGCLQTDADAQRPGLALVVE